MLPTQAASGITALTVADHQHTEGHRKPAAWVPFACVPQCPFQSVQNRPTGMLTRVLASQDSAFQDNMGITLNISEHLQTYAHIEGLEVCT